MDGSAGAFGRREPAVEPDAERGESFWAADAGPLPALPRLDGDRRVDVAIVGAGVTGLGCAYYLRRLDPRLTVAVVESHRPGAGASSRNAGFFGPFYVGWRRRLLGGGADAERYAGLGRRGLARFLAFLEVEGVGCDLTPARALHLTAGAAVEDHRRGIGAWRAQGFDVRWLEGADLAGATGGPFFAGGSWLGGWSMLHPGKLVAGLVGAALRAGALLFERTPVLALDTGRPARLHTAAGTLTAERVVVATNAYTPRLGFAVGAVVPTHHAVIATRRLDEAERRAVGLHDFPARFELAPREDTLRLTPDGRVTMRCTLGRAHDGATTWPDLEAAYAFVRETFAERYPWTAALPTEARWHGVTAHNAGARVVFGPLDPAEEHILASLGYNGTGLMPGHYNAYLLARHLTGHRDEDYDFLAGPERALALAEVPLNAGLVAGLAGT